MQDPYQTGWGLIIVVMKEKTISEVLSYTHHPPYTFCRVALFPLSISDGMRVYSHYYALRMTFVGY